MKIDKIEILIEEKWTTCFKNSSPLVRFNAFISDEFYEGILLFYSKLYSQRIVDNFWK